MAGERKEVSLKQIDDILKLVTEAMDRLDANGASPEAAAHLAMAQAELRRLRLARAALPRKS